MVPQGYNNEMERDHTEYRDFFVGHEELLPLFGVFWEMLYERFPDISVRAGRTQLSFSNRHVFACVSFLRVRKRPGRPDPYFVLTLGLPYPLMSERVAVRSEPYPGRWTTHIPIGSTDELDGELFGWIEQAYVFSEIK